MILLSVVIFIRRDSTTLEGCFRQVSHGGTTYGGQNLKLFLKFLNNNNNDILL